MLAVAGSLLHWQFSGKTETPVPATVALSPATPRAVSSELSLPENPEPVLPPETDVPFADFTAWTARYLEALPAERPAFIAEGIRLAEAHRTALADLIRRDPKRAIESAIPMVVRQDLPREVVDRLEERINVKGFFGVLGVVGQPSETPAIRREVRLADQKRYEVHTYGTRLTQTTTPDTNLTGIAIDGSLALSERGFRILEIGERLDPARPVFNTCPVSGKSSGVSLAGDGSYPPITKDTPAVAIAGEVHYLCDGRHINVLAEGGTGGPTKPTTTITTTTSTGVRSVLYIRVAFPETRKEPQTEAAAYEMMRQVNDFMVENSYGNLYLLTTVTPLVIVPRTEAFYKGGGGDEYTLQTDALTAARNLGYDSSKYDHDIVAYNGGPGTFGGLGYVGSRGIWIRTITVGVTSHELGHNLGLWHANSWDTGGTSTIGNGANIEYGNIFDTMGAVGAGEKHFNAAHKDKLKWLPLQAFVHQACTSGTYRIHAFDQARLDPGNRYALRIPKDRGRQYWAEFRQKSFGGNTSIRDGILLNWNPWTDSNGGTQLLDTTPGSPDDRLDAGIVIGRTFSDQESGIHITPIGKGGTTPESMDVVVNLGAFPGNKAPAATVNAGTLNTEIGTPVAFTVIASDPDSDALSYAWDFGDKTFSNTNSASVSKSWAAAGEYVVRCVVSDMKGHTASDSALVRVGSPATFRVSGQITLEGQPVAGVRVSNGLTGANYIGTFTDSDGSYTIAGLTEGNLTVTPGLYGYSFAPGFTNPVAVGPDFTGADFTAAKAAAVTLTVSDSDCVEGSTDTGSFRLTRTGPTTLPLNVTCFNPPRGSAAAGFDYTFFPTLPSFGVSYYTVTIPAGQSSLDIIVTAMDDTQLEGPETVTLELVARSGYVVGGAESATLTVQDSDTALPLVTFGAADGDASEAGDTASFLVTRTGSTATSLGVNFTVSGTSTATQGVDYAAIGTQITIPAGSSFTLLVITPIDDTAAEGTETVTVSLASGSGYIPTGVSTENMGTVNILDDDIAILTVTATDNSAGEASGDTGTFLITRTGPTTLPLTVNYAIGGSATHGVDYERLPGVLTIPAGANTGSVTVLPIDDGIGEPQQTVTLQLRGGITHVVGNPGVATIDIIDNSDAPIVTVGVINGIIGEPATAGTFRFTTSGTGAGNIAIHYTVTGTATPDIDYAALSGTLIMGRNATADVIVTAMDDALLEDSESITVTIEADAAYSIFLDYTATLNLTDDDQPMVCVSSTNAGFGEVGGIGRFWISRSGPTNNALAVNYVLGGTATNGDDYNLLPGSIMIPAGASGTSLFITPINDTSSEGSETVTVTVAPGAYGMGLASATQYLTDDDTLTVKVKFGSLSSGSAESAGIVNIPIILTAPTATEVTVECVINGGSAISGIDYLFAPSVVTFLPGETSKTVPLTILDDVFNEPDETVLLRLQNPNGAAFTTGGFPPTTNYTYTHTITNNDSPSPPTLGFAAVSDMGTELKSSVTIAVSLSTPQAGPVTVDYSGTGGSASVGTDYALPSGTLVFAAGETVKMFTLSIIDDTLSEFSETILISLTNPVGATFGANATFTYTIADDDAPGITIAASDSVAGEFGGDIGVFTLTRKGSLAGALSVGIAVSGGAESGEDFQALPASVAFPANTGAATVEVHPLADSLAEGDETVVVTIVPDASFTMGAPDHATVTIRDLPIDGWRFVRFGAWANTPHIAGDSANPDLDPFPNLLEFALYSEPNNTTSATLPIFAIEGTDATLTYWRPATLGDVTFTIEKWSAPNHWPAVTFSEEIVSEDGGTRMVKDRVPLNGATEMMLRLRVSRPTQ